MTFFTFPTRSWQSRVILKSLPLVKWQFQREIIGMKALKRYRALETASSKVMNVIYGMPSEMSHCRYEFGRGSNVWGEFIVNQQLLPQKNNIDWMKPKQPIILYFHGGGYILSRAEHYRHFTSRLARMAGTHCVALDYDLAPEHPFPTQINQALRAYSHLLDQSYCPSQIVFAGDSAGGNLVLATLIAISNGYRQLPDIIPGLQDGTRPEKQAVASAAATAAASHPESDTRPRESCHDMPPLQDKATATSTASHSTPPALPMPAGAVCFSPWLDLTDRHAWMEQNDHIDPFIPGKMIYDIGRLYAPHKSVPSVAHPLISPVYAEPEHLKSLPPLLFSVGQSEILLDESKRFAENAKKQGVEITLHLYPEMFHVFQYFASLLPEGLIATQRSADFIKDLLKRDKHQHHDSSSSEPPSPSPSCSSSSCC